MRQDRLREVARSVPTNGRRTVDRQARYVLTTVAVMCLAASTGHAQTVQGEPLDSVPRAVLLEVLADAGLSSARVTSVARTPRQQAEAMRNAILRSGVAAVRGVYAAAAQSVIDAYVAATALGYGPERTLDAMEAEIELVIEALGDDRRTMMHVASGRHTFDVAPSSIRDPAAFESALRRHPRVLRIITPHEGEAAFHIEVARPPERGGVG